jgi:uncharacterized protein with HEPN domain
MNSKAQKDPFQEILENLILIQEFTRDITFDQFKWDLMRRSSVAGRIITAGNLTRSLHIGKDSKELEEITDTLERTGKRLVSQGEGSNIVLMWRFCKEDLPGMISRLRQNRGV